MSFKNINLVTLEFLTPSSELLEVITILNQLGITHTRADTSNHNVEYGFSLEDFNLLKLSMPDNFRFIKTIEKENNYLVVDMERYYNNHGFKK